MNRMESIVCQVIAGKGKNVEFGTAFIIRQKNNNQEYLLLTALHVVVKENFYQDQELTDPTQYILNPIKIKFKHFKDDLCAEVVDGKWDKDQDWVLLRIKESQDGNSKENWNNYLKSVDFFPLSKLNELHNIDEKKWKTFGFPAIAIKPGIFADGNIVEIRRTLNKNEIRHQVGWEDAKSAIGDPANPNVLSRGFSGAPCIVDGAIIGLFTDTHYFYHKADNFQSGEETIFFQNLQGTLFVSPIELIQQNCNDYLSPLEPLPEDEHTRALQSYKGAIYETFVMPYQGLLPEIKSNKDSYVPLYFSLTKSENKAPRLLSEFFSDSKNKKILIQGYPGAGKSTALYMFAKEFCPNKILPYKYIPLLISLPTFANQNNQSLEEAIRNSVIPRSIKLPDGFLEKWPVLFDANWIFLFDAYDEIDNIQRIDCLEEIVNGSFKNYPSIITSRPLNSVDPDAEINGKFRAFTDLTLQALDFEQQQQLILNLLGKDKDDFMQVLAANRIMPIISNPLILTLAAAVYLNPDSTNPKTILNSRINLYEKFSKLRVNYARKQDKNKELNDEISDLVIKVFEIIAKAMFAQSEIDEETAAKLLSKELSIPNETAIRRLKIIAKRIGFLSVESGYYRWQHQTFGEYFYALALDDELKKNNATLPKVKCKVQDYSNGGHKEIALFLLAFRSKDKNFDCAGLLRRLVESNHLLLVAEALLEGVTVSKECEQYIIETLHQKILAVDEQIACARSLRGPENDDQKALELAQKLHYFSDYADAYQTLFDALLKKACEAKGDYASGVIYDLEHIFERSKLIPILNNSEVKLSVKYAIARVLNYDSNPNHIKNIARNWLKEALNHPDCDATLQQKILGELSDDLEFILACFDKPKIDQAKIIEILMRQSDEFVTQICDNNRYPESLRLRANDELMYRSELAKLEELKAKDGWPAITAAILDNNYSNRVKESLIADLFLECKITELREIVQYDTLEISLRFRCVNKIWLRERKIDDDPYLLPILQELIETSSDLLLVLEARELRISILKASNLGEQALDDILFIINHTPDELWPQKAPLHILVNYLPWMKLAWKNESSVEMANRLLVITSDWLQIQNCRAETLELRISILESQQQYDSAIKELTDFIKDESGSNWALAMRGEMYRQLEKWENAREDFQAAIKIKSSDPWDFVRYGHALYKFGQWREAIDAFCMAIRLNTKEQWFYHYLADSFTEIGRYREAIAVYNHVLKKDETNATNLARLGDVYAKTGNYFQAIDYFNKSLAQLPSYSWALKRRAEALLFAEQPSAALEDIRCFLADNPEDERGLQIEIKTLLCLGDKNSASIKLGNLFTSDNKDSWSTYLKALVALATNQESWAQALFTQAIEISFKTENSNSSVNKYNRALYYLGLNYVNHAWLEYQSILTKPGETHLVQYSLPELRNFLKIVPHHTGAKKLLNQLTELTLQHFKELKPDILSSLSWERFYAQYIKVEVPEEQYTDDLNCLSSMYCGKEKIEGLNKSYHQGKNLISKANSSQKSIVIFRLAVEDWIYGQCNFKMNSTDPYDLKFSECLHSFIEKSLPTLYHKYELQTLLFVESDLHDEFKSYLLSCGLNIRCEII